MQRRFRLTRSEDFRRVRQSGKAYAHPLLVLVTLANDESDVHVGVAASRTVGTAVKRNRAKRLLRAATQSVVASIPPGWDLVLIARPGLVSSDYFEVRQVLLSLLLRARLVDPS